MGDHQVYLLVLNCRLSPRRKTEREIPETAGPETDDPETDDPETDGPETDASETDAPRRRKAKTEEDRDGCSRR